MALETFAAVLYRAFKIFFNFYHMLVCGWSKCALFCRPIEVTAEIHRRPTFQSDCSTKPALTVRCRPCLHVKGLDKA